MLGSIGPVLVRAHDVLEVLDLLAAAGAGSVWVDGGWGVDALLGAQSREHRDLDLVVEEEDLPAVRAALQAAAFTEVPGGRAWNFVVADQAGRQVDLHVIRTGGDGTGWYGPHGQAYPACSLLGTGVIAGRAVRCLTAQYQVRSHTGYEHDGDDVHDVMALCERFGVPLPEQYVTDRPGRS
ncbi:nucleotidyltransferase domain-containing protein [Kineococcus sp. SYSU DK005]|uniref:nucleotidyltransferase domain-containing protein n=1 Tax=Kineococcus sp. SYSU DK005 TaxID=3383126 RepID=UPI003D7D4834